MVEIFNAFISIGTIILALATVVGIVLLVSKKNPISRWISSNAMMIGFVVALGAVVGSLIYSNIIGYPPCILCWYQRIAIFPLPILFLIGHIKKDRNLALAALILSGYGLVVNIYHNFIDWGGSEFISCGAGPSCLQRFVAEFGFVTIPLMSGVILFSALVVSIFALQKKN